MAETNAVLASLMARPQATENYVSVADVMRNRALAQQQILQSQQEIAASQTGQGLTQQQTEGARLANQQKQIELQDLQRQQEYWLHPEKYEQDQEPPAAPGAAPTTGTAQPQKVNFAEQMLGLDSNDPLAKKANGMIRAGITPPSVMAQAQSILGFRNSVLKQTADKQKLVTDGLATINKLLAPIGAEEDVAKRAAMLQAAEPELEKASEFDPSLHQAIMQADAAHISSILNLTGGMQDVLEYGTKQAQERAEQLKTEAPTDTQRNDATSTLQAFPLVPDTLKAAFAQQIKNAPTLSQLEKVEDNANRASESFQKSADARAQAEAMADVEKRKAVQLLAVKDDADLTKSLANTSGIRGQLDMSKGGNQQATQDAIVRFAEHEVKEGGINRFNETELNALGKGVGSRWRELEAWYAKGAKGKMPAATYKEMSDILDFEDDQAHILHDQNISALSGRMGVPLANAPNASKFTVPADAPPAPKENGHKLVKGGKTIAVSGGGQWLAPPTATP